MKVLQCCTCTGREKSRAEVEVFLPAEDSRAGHKAAAPGGGAEHGQSATASEDYPGSNLSALGRTRA